jgi:hypothetical protein
MGRSDADTYQASMLAFYLVRKSPITIGGWYHIPLE